MADEGSSKEKLQYAWNEAEWGVVARPGRSLSDLFDVLTLPLLAHWVLDPKILHPAYGMTLGKRLGLALRIYANATRVRAGTSWRAHLAMAAKILSIPPEVKGAVVECGCWLGGTTVNLSLACDIAGRDLIVYDSFEGLPEGEAGDRFAFAGTAGFFKGALQTVRDNVSRYGAPERVQFRKGWFKDTLPSHTEPVVLAFLDVDHQASLTDCVVNLWPHLTDQGYVFIDEYLYLDYCALFFSERFWKETFDAPPPGLIGAGSGVGLGQYWLGPVGGPRNPMSVAYTRKDFRALWDYRRAASP